MLLISLDWFKTFKDRFTASPLDFSISSSNGFVDMMHLLAEIDDAQKRLVLYQILSHETQCGEWM